MNCTGCAATLQRSFEARTDVSSASVSFASGIATVTGTSLIPDQLLETVRSRGFQGRLISESETASAYSDIERLQQHRERSWRRRAAIGISLWLPLELLHWMSSAFHWHGSWMPWMMFAGSLVILVIAGSEFYRSAWNAARSRTTNMDTLIAMGATTAFLYSVIVLIAGLELPLYFAEASGLLGIVSLGHWFEARASARAGSAVRELLMLQPETAEIQRVDGSASIVPTVEVPENSLIIVRPGGRIPVDGIVVEGSSAVDQSIVTGESIPVEKTPGDSVTAGALNTTGRLILRATVDGRHTTVARIANMVQTAQSGRAPIQRLADQISSVFVPVVLVVALLTFLGRTAAGSVSDGLISAVTVLIVSCPCALGLATPMAVMVGTGAASQRGILVRSAETLERLGRAVRIVFDKTGTLTVGDPAVVSIDPAANLTADELLVTAASVESASEHPLGRAIVREATVRGLQLRPITEFKSVPGQGVTARINGVPVSVHRDPTASVQIVRDGKSLGSMTLSDPLRADARQAVRVLSSMGLQISIVSGDRPAAVMAAGRELGLTPEQITAAATPESKAQKIVSFGPETVMVGDGTNDAVALAASGLGIALATGTNVAIEAAAVVIPGQKVCAIPEVIQIARLTLRTIRQNLFFAFVYNSLAIPAAAMGLLGDNGPLWAAVAMGLSDVTVVGNALRLKRRLTRLNGSAA